MPAKKPKPLKRIPAGSEVKFYARYPTDPVHVGIVIAVPGDQEAGRLHYVVRVDKTEAGNIRSRPVYFRPYASRLEAQNPKKLRLVK